MQLLGSSDFCLVQVLPPPPTEAQLYVLTLPIFCQEKKSSEMIHLISQEKRQNLLKIRWISLFVLTSNLSQTSALALTHRGQGIHLQVGSGSALVRGSGVRYSPSPGHWAPPGVMGPWPGRAGGHWGPASLQRCCDRGWQPWGAELGPCDVGRVGTAKEMLGRVSPG